MVQRILSPNEFLQSPRDAHQEYPLIDNVRLPHYSLVVGHSNIPRRPFLPHRQVSSIEPRTCKGSSVGIWLQATATPTYYIILHHVTRLRNLEIDKATSETEAVLVGTMMCSKSMRSRWSSAPNSWTLRSLELWRGKSSFRCCQHLKAVDLRVRPFHEQVRW